MPASGYPSDGVGSFMQKTMNILGVGLITGLVLLAAGCPQQELRPLNPCVFSGTVNRVKVDNVDKVDLLFMVDNSLSMARHQAALADRISILVDALTSGRLPNSDQQSFDPVTDLHIAVVNSDLGTGAGSFGLYNDCADIAGEDAQFQTRLSTAREACLDATPVPVGENFLRFVDSGSGPNVEARDLTQTFACIVDALGEQGCGYERQLDAVLKALTPSAVSNPITFNSGAATGRGDTTHAGFLRPDSLLGVIQVTDEDDCSASDLSLYDPNDARWNVTRQPGEEPIVGANLRCVVHADAALYPVSRYSQGLLALRPGQPDLLVYAAIVGVPPDLAARNPTLQQILADPRMVPAIDFEATDGQGNAVPDRIKTSCERNRIDIVNGEEQAVLELAYPPRRIVEVGLEIENGGGSAVIETICQDDFTPAIEGITRRLADALGASCLERAQQPNAQGEVACEVLETLPTEGEITRCDQLSDAGREFVRTDGGAEVCRLTQLPVDRSGNTPQPAAGAGWYYDDFSADVLGTCPARAPQRISFSVAGQPRPGSSVRLECTSRAQAQTQRAVSLGASCGGDADCTGGSICDDISRTCQMPCVATVDCVDLGAFVCERASREARGLRPICVNPTCSE